MRTYDEIYSDYCDWAVKKSGNIELSYKNLLNSYDKNTVKSFLYKEILKLCFDKKNGLYYFCKFIIGNLLEIGYPRPFRYNMLLRKWDKLLKKNRYICIMCARGHGKSVFYSEIFTIYDMFLFKHRRTIMVSASQEQANRILEELKTIIVNNEWLITKRSATKWAAETIGYNDGYVLVKGIGSEILGQHVDRIVVDDILRSDNKLSDAEIEDYIDMTLDPMLLNRRGQMIVVGTPKSDTDIFTTIENRVKEGSVWSLNKYPAIVNYEKRILQCPDRFTWEDLMQKRLSMGPLKFGREYQLEFFSRDASLFPEWLLKVAKDKGKDMYLIPKIDKRDKNWVFVAGVDVARSGSASADYSVLVLLAFNTVNNEKQIVHIWREKGLKISEQAVKIAEISRRFNNLYVLVEQNNFGQDLIDDLIDKWNVNVDAFITGGRGQKKEELIRFLITAFEHEQIIFPRGDEESKKSLGILEEELSKFCELKTPMGNYKYESVGSHDDSLCEGTSIITLQGIKNVEDILRGDNVLTHKGNFFQVKETMSKTCKRDIITIKAFGNIPFSLTDNHKIFVLKKPKRTIRKNLNMELEEVNSQDIRKDKHLLISPISRFEVNLDTIDMKDYFPTTHGWKYDDNYYWNYRWKNKRYERFIKIDEEFAFFIGHFVGDGYYGGSIAFNKKDKHLIEKIRGYLKKIGINARESKIKGNAFNLEFCCIPFQNFLKKQIKSKDKKMFPIFTQYLNPKLQKEFIKGYWSADGSIVRNRMTSHTISKTLAFQVRHMFLRNDIVCNINEIKRHRYEVINRNQFVMEVSKFHTEKFLGKKTSTVDLASSFIRNGYLISCINNITTEKNQIKNVYDLQVYKDKSYCPNGIAIRNCVMALALANRATQTVGVPFAVSEFGGESKTSGFDPLYKSFGESKNESDLVRMIRMGLIK